LFKSILGSTAHVGQICQVFQMMLSYWVWLKKDKYWRRGDVEAREAARHAIQIMLSELLKLWPRTTGQGWEKAKFHENLHIPEDIERNGAPQGWNGGPTENNHIATVKNFAQQTNWRRETLDGQIGTRNAETFIINTAYQKMTMCYADSQLEGDNDHPWVEGITRNCSKALMYIYKEGGVVSCGKPIWFGSKLGHIHPLLKSFLENHFGALPAADEMLDSNGRKAHTCVRLIAKYARGGTIF
jgi:hypothetical protein